MPPPLGMRPVSLAEPQGVQETGAATHRGADDRRLAVRADTRCSRAAGGGQGDGFLSCLPVAEQVIEVPKFSCSACFSRSPFLEPQMAEQLVEVPTVLSLAVPSKSSTFLFRLVVVVIVFMVLSQDIVQQRRTSSRPLTFQPQVVDLLAVANFFLQDRVRRSGLPRRPSIFQILVLVAVFTVFSQVRAANGGTERRHSCSLW